MLRFWLDCALKGWNSRGYGNTIKAVKAMKTLARWITALILVLTQAQTAMADHPGPLTLKNRFPMHLLFLTPRPWSAQIPEQRTLGATVAVDYAPVYFSHANDAWRFLMDMEMTTVDLVLSYGLTPRLALRAELPLVSMNAGFLDGMLEAYHDAIGVGNYGREQRPDNAFAYEISREERPWLKGESGSLSPADLTLSAQWQMLPRRNPRAWAASAILSLKVPSGNANQGLGSGRFDYGLYVNADRRIAPWSWYVMAGMAFNHDPDTLGARVEARPSLSLFTGLGYQYSARTTWLIQVNSYTSPIRRTGISEVDNPSVELALGLHYQAEKNWGVEFAFGEDLTRAAPDFSVRLGVRHQFQLGRD